MGSFVLCVYIDIPSCVYITFSLFCFVLFLFFSSSTAVTNNVRDEYGTEVCSEEVTETLHESRLL